VETVGLVAPLANGVGGSGGQQEVSAEGADGGDGAVFGDLNFEDNVAGAVGGEGVGRILRLSAADEADFGFLGRQPDALGCGDLGCGELSRRRCFYDSVARSLGGIGPGGSWLQTEDDLAVFVHD